LLGRLKKWKKNGGRPLWNLVKKGKRRRRGGPALGGGKNKGGWEGKKKRQGKGSGGRGLV